MHRDPHSDRILILDFGSQYTQLIARVLRGLGVYCEIYACDVSAADIQSFAPRGVILSGGPDSAYSEDRLKPDSIVFQMNIPVLGICYGMQIMANSSDEGVHSGLGWIPGKVKLFDTSILHKPKIPHLGWNTVEVVNDVGLLRGIDSEQGFYFIHSYFYEVEDESHIMTKTFYGNNFASSINRENIYGTQFHPEKSHLNGMKVLKNFAEL